MARLYRAAPRRRRYDGDLKPTDRKPIHSSERTERQAGLILRVKVRDGVGACGCDWVQGCCTSTPPLHRRRLPRRRRP